VLKERLGRRRIRFIHAERRRGPASTSVGA
jgi:hypothetical protein